ncbi:MAG TPA: VWA domain-containing protein [Isosphaeraceae bacterium]|jgi:hypothetical protein|nr:VWA domain-containing protein [Isosphaeraceae bacterium]
MRFGNFSRSNFPVDFSSPLGAAQWAALAGVPLAIIALYFLKLRRRPVQVPSTLLWRRSMEDLHVNSLFQWLRRNLLLYLQLLMIFLLMLALAGPRLKGTAGQGQRLILAIDNSASMSATDVRPTRLDEAKRHARKLIEEMEADDLAMILTFADRARVASSYTGNKAQLLKRLDEIQPSRSTTSLREALQVASGLANPQRQYGEGVVATSVVAPKLYLFTDGGFPDVSGFSLGNLEPVLTTIGPPVIAADEGEKKAGAQGESPKPPPSDNVAILALQTAKNEEKGDTYQVFGRVHNYRGESVSTRARLLKHDPDKPGGAGETLDVKELTIAPQAEKSFEFDIQSEGAVEMEVRLEVKDSLPIDDRAFTLIGKPRRAQVLLVTPGDFYLTKALRTPASELIADLQEVTPEEAKAGDVARDLAAGRYDLVVFDRFRPDKDPAANALYFGIMPPGPAFESARPMEGLITVLDWKIDHPLLQYIRDLPTINILKATKVGLPAGASSLIDGAQGSLALARPREGYTDVVITFPIFDGKDINTDWPTKISFPLFFLNCLRILGNVRESTGEEIHQPGQPIVLRSESIADTIEVTPPPGNPRGRSTLKRTPRGTFVYNDADVPGLYHARWGKGKGQEGGTAFAVNLFDVRESDLAPRDKIQLGYTPVAGTRRTAPARIDYWWRIALAALALVLIEWYIYNRKVYI